MSMLLINIEVLSGKSMIVLLNHLEPVVNVYIIQLFQSHHHLWDTQLVIFINRSISGSNLILSMIWNKERLVNGRLPWILELHGGNQYRCIINSSDKLVALIGELLFFHMQLINKDSLSFNKALFLL